MSRRVDPGTVEETVGVKRHLTRHYARALSATEEVVILHSRRCKADNPDLRDCPFSIALDRGIIPVLNDWPGDVPVVLAEHSTSAHLVPGAPDSAVLAATIGGRRYRATDDASLKAAIGRRLDEALVEHSVDVLTRGGRIDLIAGQVGVVVKTKGPPESLHRQLEAYRDEFDLDELLVVTTRQDHRAIPGYIANKRVRVVLITTTKGSSR